MAWKDGAKFMMDPATAYFLKKYYPHVIKWWLVVYNPEFFRVWPSKAEEEEALRIEAKEAKRLALETQSNETINEVSEDKHDSAPDDAAFNATTGSYSGLYGQKPVDADTQAALDAIMNNSSNQNSVDFLLSGGEPTTGAAYAIADAPAADDETDSGDVILPPEQDEIVKEANAIYERLLQEASEDEAKKQAEIEIARQQAESSTQNAG